MFSGSKNQGSLQSGNTTRGKFDPKHSCRNFAVLDENSLRNNSHMPSVIMCGIIEESFKLLDKNKQYVISTGLAKDDVGDINLWGLEEPSTEERQRRKEENLKEVTEIEENILELLKENSTESIEQV